MEQLGHYYGDLRTAFDRAKLVSGVLVIGWCTFPVTVQTAFHPTDAVGFQYWLQRQPVPRFYTEHMIAAGEISAIMALISLGLFMLGATVMFYRNAGFWVKLWPIAGVAVGIIGNAAWGLGTGYFDRTGALAGAASLALMVICEAVCEHLGADFVFGQGKRPQRA